jgi:glucokinase-like ROK family protein
MQPTRTTADQALVRELNLSSVLRLIQSGAPLSRAKVASLTGLNKSTVSSLGEELLERRLVLESGINSVGAGRPATLLELNPKAGTIVGVELGVDFVSIVVTDFTANILWRRQVPADPTQSQEKTLEQTQGLIDEAIASSMERGVPILGLSFAIPGTVDLAQGTLIFAPNLSWHNVPLRRRFSGTTGLKVFIENDANAAAVAEHLFGAARRLQDFVFVFIGVGLGGGLFLNGQLYRGRGGYAGEIGHTHIMAEPYNLPCHCGNLGCWETYANQASVLRRVQARLDGRRSSLILSLMEKEGAPLSLSIIKRAADAGDADAIASLTEAGTAIGSGCAGLVNIFNPEKIVLGGPVSIAGDYLLPAIKQNMNERSMPENVVQTEVGLSAFGSDASLIGAAAIVIDDILTNPTHVEKEVMPARV